MTSWDTPTLTLDVQSQINDLLRISKWASYSYVVTANNWNEPRATEVRAQITFLLHQAKWCATSYVRCLNSLRDTMNTNTLLATDGNNY